MDKYTQYGFLSVLFILVMFFAVQSLWDSPTAIEVKREHTVCEGICEPNCSLGIVRITGLGSLLYRGELLPLNEVIEQIKIDNMNCEIVNFKVVAESNVKHGRVMEVNTKIAELLPQIKLSWEVIDA